MARGRSHRNSLHLQSYIYEGEPGGSPRTPSPHLRCCSKSQAACGPCWRGGGGGGVSEASWCGTSAHRKVLLFIVTGVLQIVVAFLIGVIYFSVRTLTSSLEHVETIPTYANGILVSKCCNIYISIYFTMPIFVASYRYLDSYTLSQNLELSAFEVFLIIIIIMIITSFI